MADNFTFNRPYKPFCINVQVPERTIQQAGQTLEELVKAPTAPLFEFLEENEGVFNGDVAFGFRSLENGAYFINVFRKSGVFSIGYPCKVTGPDNREIIPLIGHPPKNVPQRAQILSKIVIPLHLCPHFEENLSNIFAGGKIQCYVHSLVHHIPPK